MSNNVHRGWEPAKEPVIRWLAKTFIYSKTFGKVREEEALNINPNL